MLYNIGPGRGLCRSFPSREADRALEGQRVFHVRYMEDLLVLSRTRRLPREAVKTINGGFAQLGVFVRAFV